MLKRIGALYLLLTLTGSMLAACAVQPQRQENHDAPQPTLVPTAVAVAKSMYTVERGEVIYDVDLSGRITAAIDESLSFPIEGIVAAVYVERNDLVEAGDAIAELDTRALEEALADAQTTLTIAQARLESTRAQIERDRRRAEIQLAIAELNLAAAVAAAGEEPSQADQFEIDRLELQRELRQLDVNELEGELDPALQADVDAAALAAAAIEAALESATLAAPFSGRITSLSALPGLAVTAFQPLGVLADESQLEVRANVRENQMEELAEGMPVLISVANAPGETYPGTLSHLPYPYGSGGAPGFEETDTMTHFTFDNPQDASRFEPGDRVTVNAVIESRDDVLVLPAEAIREFSGRDFVVVQEGDSQRRADVTLGISGNGRVEIASGLNEGDRIVGQ